jgi:large subunit ribosomal protein L34e
MMPRPAQRSRSFKKKRVNTPGGTATVHYVKKGPGGAVCGACGKPLHGVARGLPAKVRKLPKSRRRPERPYGGSLCSSCTRSAVKSRNMRMWENA